MTALCSYSNDHIYLYAHILRASTPCPVAKYKHSGQYKRICVDSFLVLSDLPIDVFIFPILLQPYLHAFPGVVLLLEVDWLRESFLH